MGDHNHNHHDHSGHHNHHHQMPLEGRSAGADPEPEFRSDGHGHEMKMYFHGGYTEVILFDSWRIDSLGGLIGSMVACFFLGILYEGLKFARDHVTRTSGFKTMRLPIRNRRRQQQQQNPTPPTSSASSSTINNDMAPASNGVTASGDEKDRDIIVDASNDAEDPNNLRESLQRVEQQDSVKMVETSMFSVGHLLLTLMHFVQVTLAYFLMLIVMTYNTWLCLAVAAGATVGYFLFGWRKNAIVENSDHCH